MKKTRFTEAQIVSILKLRKAGKSVRDICCRHSIPKQKNYKIKAEYGGMEVREIALL